MEEAMQEMGARVHFLEQQLAQLQHQLGELAQVRDTVIEMQKVEHGQKILLPLGAGVFIHALVDDTSKVLMNVGAQTVVEKDIKDSQTLIEEQVSKLEDVQLRMQKEMAEIKHRMQMLQLQKE